MIAILNALPSRLYPEFCIICFTIAIIHVSLECVLKIVAISRTRKDSIGLNINVKVKDEIDMQKG